MEDLIVTMKSMRRAMQPYVLFLYELVSELKAENVLEIGFRQGQSTRSILSALKHNDFGKLTTISIDLPDRKGRVPEELLSYWHPISSDSHDNYCLEVIEDKLFQVILIDGDHSYGGVKQDFNDFKNSLADGGYILFHDVLNMSCGVPKFWNKVKKNKNYEALTLNYGAGMGILRKK
jgi:predicted O-methyltransferase YrrM